MAVSGNIVGFSVLGVVLVGLGVYAWSITDTFPSARSARKPLYGA